MTERRPDPAIEVFGVEEAVWTRPQTPDRAAAGSPDIRGGSAEVNQSDEIRQGGPPEDRPGLSRFRSNVQPTRIPLFRGRTVTLSQLAATVAGIVVAAFLAGLIVGHGTRSGPGDPSAGVETFEFTPAGASNSIFPTEPSFTIRVAAPTPVPSGSAGPTSHLAGSEVYALQLAADPANRSGQSLDRRDAGALTGPWSLIVRRSDGSLGRHSSVVTYPAPAPTDVRRRTPIRVGPVEGYVDFLGGILWPIDGKFARIRGDLGRATLAAIAARVTVRHGRPVLAHPPTRFRVVAAEPYRAPVVTESRYDSQRVDSGPIDGLVFADVLRGASFEEALYVEGSGPGGSIGGHPAVLSSVGGGDGTLAWESAPGLIVFVGYSGELDAPSAGAALRGLARGGRLLDHEQWTATHPSVVYNTNAYF